MASSARALSAAAATSFATRASDTTHRSTTTSMSRRRRGRCAPNILAQLPALPSASADRPSTSGRQTSGVPQRGRGAHQRPLSRPPAAEKGSSSTTPNGSTPLSPGTVISQLPLFPLNLVAFPHADVPLHIFEARYRVLFSTLLSGDKDIDEGMVSDDKPWVGTRSFGLCWSDGKGGVAGVGTRLAINKHAMLPDGRMFVESRGVERFRILNVVQRAPVVVAEVEVLPELLEDARGKAGESDEEVRARLSGGGTGGENEEEEEEGPQDAESLARAVADAFRELIAINMKMGLIDRAALAEKWKVVDDERSGSGSSSRGGSGEDGPSPPLLTPIEPPELTSLGPAALSHWVSAYFADSPMHQQVLLQEDSVPRRLRSLLDVLRGTVGFLRAKSALEAMSGGGGGGGDGGGGGSPLPPPGRGPD